MTDPASQHSGGYGGSAALYPGLADPIFDAQAAFRILLDALAHPGQVYDLQSDTDSVADVSAEVLAILLSLGDADTPIWIDPIWQSDILSAHLAFHTGAPVTNSPEEAVFAVVSPAAFAAPFKSFSIGTPEYPDRSTTVIIPVEGFGDRAPLILEGPGIEGDQPFFPEPMPEGLAGQITVNAALYPLGIDMIFTAPGKVAAVPRSSQHRPSQHRPSQTQTRERS